MKNRLLKSSFFIVGAILFFAIINGACMRTSYTKTMVKAVKKAIVGDFSGYRGINFPTNNFGLLTTYEKSASDKNMLCAMAGCFDSLHLLNKEDSLKMGGLADIGKGAAISLNEKTQNQLSTKVILPELWKSLAINGGVESKEVKNVTLSFGPTYKRQLNRLKLEKFIGNLPENDPYKKRFNTGELIVVIADVIVENMEIIVDVESTAAIAVDAKIGLVGKAAKDTLKGEFKKVTEGRYSFKINQPLIVLRLVRKQPQGGFLGATDNFDDWLPVIDPI